MQLLVSSRADQYLALPQGQWAAVLVAAGFGKDLVLIRTWPVLR
jgi:hypothetical protein